MAEIYRWMQRQARSWERTWDRVVSRARRPGYGNSDGKGIGTTRQDLTLSPPPLPVLPALKFQPGFNERYAKFLAEARERMLENDRLTLALQANFPRVDRNRYNLEVFLALARFMGHHWRLLAGLAEAEKSLEKASATSDAATAVGHLVAAHNAVASLRKEGESVFRELTVVFEKSRYPKGRAVGGRRFVHVLDDTKDHWADRTPDLGFMMAPERSIGLDRWTADLARVIDAYAKAKNVPVKGLAAARLEE
jgi:hypothetical protein